MSDDKRLQLQEYDWAYGKKKCKKKKKKKQRPVINFVDAEFDCFPVVEDYYKYSED